MLNMKLAFRLWAAAILLLTALGILETSAIAASSPCPPGGIGASTDCGSIITIDDLNGAVVSHNINQPPYDKETGNPGDDTLVGVINNSSNELRSMVLRSALPIFGFETDGICGRSLLTTQLFRGATDCPSVTFPQGYTPTGYEGPHVTFSNISADFTEGTVTFSPAIPAGGGTAYFALEDVISSGAVSCPSVINHTLNVFKSDAGYPGIVMNATFTPSNNNIVEAAAACGFKDFNWISEITVPAPVPFWKMPAKSDPTRLLADTAYNDPVQGGFTYDPSWNTFPYFWDQSNSDPITAHRLSSNTTSTTLSFIDRPADACLPDPNNPSQGLALISGPPSLVAQCAVPTGGSIAHYAANGSALKFKTRVVGIHTLNRTIPVELGIFFTWESKFNGSFGGASRTANLQDPDPGSGTGGITITEVHDVTNYQYNGIVVTTVNGVPIEGETIPPAITMSATPMRLWPPNNLMVPVTVSGTIKDTGGGGVNSSTAAYDVLDEYGLVQPKGAVTLSANGSYSFAIQLQASRKGNDRDGRQYLITVGAEDLAGNKGSSSTLVIVPHDQRSDPKH